MIEFLTFEGFTFSVGRYADNANVAVVAHQGGMPYATCTVNTHLALLDNQVAIPEYKLEGEFVRLMQRAGMIGEDVLFTIPSGWVDITVYAYLGKVPEASS